MLSFQVFEGTEGSGHGDTETMDLFQWLIQKKKWWDLSRFEECQTHSDFCPPGTILDRYKLFAVRNHRLFWHTEKPYGNAYIVLEKNISAAPFMSTTASSEKPPLILDKVWGDWRQHSDGLWGGWRSHWNRPIDSGGKDTG